MALHIMDFGRTARRLSRNPLGIIALFIVLVYAIAGFVLVLSSYKLQPSERIPLVWFIVIFPIIVLVVFYRLVTRHHVKLYAPYDFPDVEGFFRALKPDEQKRRLEEEVKSIEGESPQVEIGKTMPVEMKARISQSIRNAVVLAEELALRQLEDELGVPILRQIAIGPNYGFDGLFLRNNRAVAVEIKFTRQRQWHKIVQRALDNMNRVISHKAASFLLVIVSEGLTREEVEMEAQRTTNVLSSSTLPVELRAYDFGALKSKYGIVD